MSATSYSHPRVSYLRILPAPKTWLLAAENDIMLRIERYSDGIMTSASGYIFTVVSALSLALCIASIGLWVRSGSHLDTLALSSAASPHGRVDGPSLASCNGSLRYWHTELDYPRLDIDLSHRLTLSSRSMARSAAAEWKPGGHLQDGQALLGFYYRTADSTLPIYSGSNPSILGSMTDRVVAVPYWFLVLATALLPVAWCLRRRYWIRICSTGLCPR